MTPTDLVLERLRERGCNPRSSRAGQWTARCPNGPAHKNGDKNASFSFADGRDGCCVLHCEGPCATEDLVAALGLEMADLFPPKEQNNGHDPVVATYDYPDEHGTLVMRVLRTAAKRFWQETPDGRGGWAKGLQGLEERPLYRLPQILEASRAGDTIWIAEGEKDVEALVRAGVEATCNPAGAKKWRDEHTRWMAGAKRVDIVADDDEVGHEHARMVAAALRPVVDQVYIWLPHEGCKDAAEHVGQGRRLTDLRPFELAEQRGGRLRANLYIGAEIFDLPATEWLIDGVIQLGGLTVIYGPPKSFKTFVALDMVMHIANGMAWRGLKTSTTRVLYVVAEGAPGVGPRARAWCQHYGGTVDNLAWITVAPDLFSRTARGDEVAELIGLATELDCGLIVFDTLARSMPGGEENSAKDMGIVVANVDHIREEAQCGAVLVHHTGKDQMRGMRGSNSLQAAVDTSLEIIGDKHAVNARVADQKNAESDRAWWWKPTIEQPSLVLVPTEGLDSSSEVRDLNILRQLQMIDNGDGVSTNTWLAAVDEREICGKTTFHERLKAIKDGGQIENKGTTQRPRWGLTMAGLTFIDQSGAG